MRFIPLVSPSAIIFIAVVLLALCVAGFVLALRAKPRPRVLGQMVTWGRRLAMSAVLVFILCGPSVLAGYERVVSNVEVVIAVDRTGSMAAEDGPDGAPRLDAVKRDIRALVDATAGSRYSVVTWDSSARVELPLTTDASAVLAFADTLHQEVSKFSAGSSAELPSATLLDLLQRAEEQRPDNRRYLFVFTDGEQQGTHVVPREDLWQELGPLIDGGAVFGYGTAEGGRMLQYLSGLTQSGAQYIQDGEHDAISMIDVENLERIADALGVPMLENPSVAEVRSVGADTIAASSAMQEEDGRRQKWRLITWAPALVLALLVACEVYADLSEVLKMRRDGAI